MQTSADTWEAFEKKYGVYYRPAGIGRSAEHAQQFRRNGPINNYSSAFPINIPNKKSERKKQVLDSTTTKSNDQDLMQPHLGFGNQESISQTTDVVLSSTQIEHANVNHDNEEKIAFVKSLKHHKLSPIAVPVKAKKRLSQKTASLNNESRAVNAEKNNDISALPNLDCSSEDEHSESYQSDMQPEDILSFAEKDGAVETELQNKEGYSKRMHEKELTNSTNNYTTSDGLKITLQEKSFNFTQRNPNDSKANEQSTGVSLISTPMQVLANARTFLNKFKMKTHRPAESRRYSKVQVPVSQSKVNHHSRIDVCSFAPPLLEHYYRPYPGAGRRAGYRLSELRSITDHLAQWRYNLEKKRHDSIN